MRLHNLKRLRTLMLIQEVTQRELAKAAGYKSHAHLGLLLRGDVKTLPTDRATRIALYLGVGIDDLFVPEGSSGARHSDQRNATRSAA